MQAGWQDPPEYRDSGGGQQFALPSLTPMVKRVLLANVALFLVTFVLFLFKDSLWRWPPFEPPPTDELGNPTLPINITSLFGIHPGLWREWAPFFPVWQLLTWGFLHDVEGLGHILFNMLGLFFFGTMVEGILGGRRFLSLYVGALLVSGMATLLVGLLVGTSVPTIGASGAVLAVIVAAATFRPLARVIFIIFPMTLRTLALIIVGSDAFYLLLQVAGKSGGDNVAHLAHLSGAALGFLAVKRGWIWKDPVESLDRWREVRVEQRAVEDSVELDRVLVKIQKEGIGSLSSAEKALLKRASKKR